MKKNLHAPTKMAAFCMIVLITCEVLSPAFNIKLAFANTQSFSLTAEIKAGPYLGSFPQFVAYDPSNGLLYVTNGNNSVCAINVSSSLIIATIPVGNNPQGITYDPSNGNIYVSNFGSSSISVISGKTNSVTATINLSPVAGPMGLAYDPSNGYIYVADEEDTPYGGVTIISPLTNSVITTFSMPSGAGSTPTDLTYDSANNMIYVCSGLVYGINAQNQFTSPITFPNLGTTSIVYDSTNGNLYVNFENSPDIGVIYSSSNTGMITISGPSSGAFWTKIAFDSQTNDIFDPNNAGQKVSIIDGSTNTLFSTITLPANSFPFGITWDPSNGNIYVVDANINMISVISPSVPPSYTVTITGASGGAIGYSFGGNSGTVQNGQSIAIQAYGTIFLTGIPDSQHNFISWSTSGAVSVPNSTISSTQLIVNGNGGVTASFGSNLACYITPGNTIIQIGYSVTFTAYAWGGSKGYTYVWYWTGAQNGQQSTGASNQFTFTPSIIGSYNVYFVVTDSSGNQNWAIYSTVTVQNSPPPATGNLQVTVYDAFTGFPMSGVSLQMTSAPSSSQLQTATTNAGGDYIWSSLQVGAYAVTASKNGYHTGSGSTYFSAGQTGEIVVVLSSNNYRSIPLTAPSSIGQNVAANAGYVYYAESSANQIAVYSQATSGFMTNIQVGRTPVSLATLNNWVICANQADGTVSVINSSTNTVVATINVGKQPIGIATNPSTDQVFVTDFGSSDMSVINLIQFPQTNTYQIPLVGRPAGVAVDSSSNTAYISIYDSHSIQIVQVNPTTTQSYTTQGTINVGAYPMGIAEDEMGDFWVANSGSASISMILPSSARTSSSSFDSIDFPVNNSPVGIATISGGYSEGYQVSTIVSYQSSDKLTFISYALRKTQQPLTDLTYAQIIPGIASVNSTAAITINTATNTIMYINTVPVDFETNSPSSFVINKNLIVGQPYFGSGSIYMPMGVYELEYSVPAGYQYESLTSTGGVTLSPDLTSINVMGAGALELSVQQIPNWENSNYFKVSTYSINLGQIESLLTSNDGLAQFPIELYVITASASTSEAQFTQELNYFFGITVPSDYNPQEVILIHFPVVPIINTMFSASLQAQSTSYSLASLIPASLLAGTSTLQTDTSGSLNIALTISSSTNTQQLINDLINTLYTALSNIVKPNAVAVLKSGLQTILENYDLTLNVVTSSLSQTGPLSGYTLIELSTWTAALNTITSVTKLMSDINTILSAPEDFEFWQIAAAISIPPIDVVCEVKALTSALDGAFAYLDILAQMLPVVDPSITNNQAFNGLVDAESFIVSIIDPNGSTISPSLYQGSTFLIGYNATSGDTVYSSQEGILFKLGPNSYIADLYENIQYPTSATVQLNQLGGNDSVPYIVNVRGYNTTSAVANYVGISPGTSDLSVASSIGSDGSLSNQVYLYPQVLIGEGSTGYDIYATAHTNDGALADANAGALILNGTTYSMQALNSSTFECTVPYTAASSNLALVYLNTPGLAGGYVGIRLPLHASIVPLSGSIIIGQPQSFNSSVTGGILPYSYQWYLNGTPISGAVNPTWTFMPLLPGSYVVCVEVNDSLGVHVTSSNAIVEAGTRHIVVTSVMPSETVVVEGDTLDINVTVANLGTFAETFNVTLYGELLWGWEEENDTFPLYVFTGVTLTPGSTRTLTVSVTLPFFPLSTYVLKAHAWPLPGETQVSDNTCLGGFVRVFPATNRIMWLHALWRPWKTV